MSGPFPSAPFKRKDVSREGIDGFPETRRRASAGYVRGLGRIRLDVDRDEVPLGEDEDAAETRRLRNIEGGEDTSPFLAPDRRLGISMISVDENGDVLAFS
jgi:hypothetical protein